MGSLAVLLSVLAVVRAQQAGMCQQRYTTCDEPRSETPGEPGGFGTGGCVTVVTDECGSTQIDVTDGSGSAVFEPLSLPPGQTITTQCRKVAEMDTSGLRLSTVRLDDPEIAAAIGSSGAGGGGAMALLSSIQTMEQVVSIFASLGGEICITLEDAHITTEVTQACVVAELKAGDAALMEPIEVGCWYEGLACFNATSCSDCTSMADTARASGRYDGAGSCGWCAATGQCLLGGTGGPRCQHDGGCDERFWTLEPALCPATPGGSANPSGADNHAACIASSMLTSGSSALNRQSSTDLESGDTAVVVGGAGGGTAAVIAALIGGGFLGFLGGSCCGAGVGEIMQVVGHRVFPDCVQDPYRRRSKTGYSKEETLVGRAGSSSGNSSSPGFAVSVVKPTSAADNDASAPSLVPPVSSLLSDARSTRGALETRTDTGAGAGPIGRSAP
jgi:hypothetical protein|eukprot:COSAG02_NODE_139_length_34376_cov_233.853663_26_plen_445_part_00